MKYMGAKSRISKYIIPIIQKYINTSNVENYYEPFVGGANIIDKIVCEKRYGTDTSMPLIALLEYVRDGGELLESVSRDLYNDVRKNQNTSYYPEWEIGNVGFLASYNGRFFDGGYAKSGYERTKSGLRYRDYYAESKRNLEEQRNKLNGICFACLDYDEVYFKPNSLIYCDPPYKGTKQYTNSKLFDYDKFWDWTREMSKKNIVLISEETAPADFKCIWEQKVNRSIKAQDKSYATEKLFILKIKEV